MEGMIGQAGLVGLSSETYVFDLQKRMFLGTDLPCLGQLDWLFLSVKNCL